MDGETPKVEAATAETEQEQVQDVAKATEGADDIKALLEAARKEAVTERKKRQQFEARLAEIEKAQLSDAERAKAEAEEAKALAKGYEDELRKLKVRSVVTERAGAKGFVDVDAAYRLLDVEWDLDGDLKAQADAALDALAAERKYLISTPAAAPVTSPANGQTRTGTKLTMDDLKRMTREELSALPKEEVDAVLRGGA